MIYQIKNKKGMLLASETLKIVLSVISIGFLIVLLFSIYYATSKDNDYEQAQRMMDRIKFTYDSFGEIQNSFVLHGVGPGGWNIFTYSGEEEKPNACGGIDCICICETPTINLGNAQLKKCTKDGVCEMFEPLIKKEKIEIKKDGTTNIAVYKSDGWYGVKEV